LSRQKEPFWRGPAHGFDPSVVDVTDALKAPSARRGSKSLVFGHQETPSHWLRATGRGFP